MIKYKFKLQADDFTKVCDLYKVAGWWEEPCSPELVFKLVSNSFCFLSAWEGDKLVGMGRVISDSFSDAYIQDVFVDQDHRKQGIAGKIVDSLVTYCEKNNIHWIALIAAPGSESVYTRSGFEKMIDHTPMRFTKRNH